MNCPFCGEKISAGAVKCKNCSEYVGSVLSYDEEMKLRARKKIAVPGKKSGYAWIWNIAAVLILAAVIAGLYFFSKQA